MLFFFMGRGIAPKLKYHHENNLLIHQCGIGNTYLIGAAYCYLQLDNPCVAGLLLSLLLLLQDVSTVAAAYTIHDFLTCCICHFP